MLMTLVNEMTMYSFGARKKDKVKLFLWKQCKDYY